MSKKSFPLISLVALVIFNWSANAVPDGHNRYNLVITQTPDYLFAASKYATPIKFKINGCEKAEILSIRATFECENLKKSIDVSQRFVALDGPEQENRSTNTYTAFIPRTFYDNLHLGNYKSNSAVFSVTVEFRDLSKGGPSIVLSSDPNAEGDHGKIAEAFADCRVNVVDLPLPTKKNTVILDLNDPTQQAVSKTGSTRCERIKNYSNVTQNFSTPPYNPFGFDTDGDSVTATVEKKSGSIAAAAALFDDKDYFAGHGGGDAFMISSLGLRHGLYFFVSYGGRTVAPLGPQEAVMDLSKRSGNFSLDFTNGSIWSAIDCENNQDLGLGNASKGALNFILSALAKRFPLIACFSTISEIANIFESLLIKPPTQELDNAQGSVYVTSIRSDKTSSVAEIEDLCLINKYSTKSILLGTGTSGKPCNVGDQWNWCIDVHSAVTALARMPQQGSVFSRAFVSYSTTDADLYSAEVIARE